MRIVRNWVCLIGSLIVLAAMASRFAPVLLSESEPDTPYVAYYYYKTTCPACRKLEPTIDELEAEYGECVTFRWRSLDFLRPKRSVGGVPTVVLETAEGMTVRVWVGSRPKADFTNVLDKVCDQ